jgi:hypothetical protein
VNPPNHLIKTKSEGSTTASPSVQDSKSTKSSN